MGIKIIKKGLRKAQHINFTWTVNNYDISRRYTNKIECGKTTVKLLMEPCYVNGKIKGANPFIMFDDVEGIENESKMFSYIINQGIKYDSSFGYIRPLKLKQRYNICATVFLEEFNYVRHLDMRRNLVLNFEIIIGNDSFEKETKFLGTNYFKDMENLFNNKTFSDCEFDVDGSLLTGHKFILAVRAPILLNALESAGSKLTIKGFSDVGFKEFLRYLYCEKILDKSQSTIFEVVALAHTYNVQDLKTFCEQILTNILNGSNANSIYQLAHKYDLTDDIKKKSFELIQVMFKKINQKLPDEFINDPKYVNNLITLAESLINGLKKKEMINEQELIEASSSVQQMKVESAINEIYKEAKNVSDQIESAGECQTDNEEVEEFCLLENYTQNVGEFIYDEDLEYDEFVENIPERYLDIIIEEDTMVSNSQSEQSNCDNTENNKTFDVDENSNTAKIKPEEEIEMPTIVDIEVVDQVEGPVKNEVTNINEDMKNIEDFIIQVTDEVTTIVDKAYNQAEEEVDACSGTEDIAEQNNELKESTSKDKIQPEIQIVKDFEELIINDDIEDVAVDTVQIEV